VSGVVFLPPRPKERRIQSAITCLRSLVHRASVHGADCVYPIGVTGLPPGELRVRSRRSRGQHIVELLGTLDRRTREQLVVALEEALEGDAEEIVLDLGDLESIDHAGLDAVLTAHLRASDQLKVLVIVPGPGPVQRTLDDAGAPFLYGVGQRGRVAGRERSRGRRTSLSARPGAHPHSARRFR
jgi:anti-anti-sigma factor